MTNPTLQSEHEVPGTAEFGYGPLAWEAIANRPNAEHVDLYDTQGMPIYLMLAAGDRTEISELLRAIGPSRATVIEFASGGGRLTVPMVLAGHDVRAVDLSQQALKELEAALTLLPITAQRRCAIEAADMRTYLANDTFDVVVIGSGSWTLLQEAERPRLWTMCAALLADNGRLILVQPHPAAFEGDELVSRHTTDSGEVIVFDYRPSKDQRDITIVFDPINATRPIIARTRTHLVDFDLLRIEFEAAGLLVRRTIPLVNPAGLRLELMVLQVRQDVS